MSDPAIRAEHLAKRFRLGEFASYGTLRDWLMKPFSRSADRSSTELWALDDVSFAIEPGEVVGVIGRNGAGKTSLLKLMAKILRPTRGFAEVRGRVASLLEVGTGFHGELSGRENVFMNGAILGMSRREIRERYDSIVAFAEMERFMETPVKHYSSGMAVRLAFSVAAHLEADILLVDEVLAVGDASFQKKCLGKMRETAGHGRTVLFVSHNMQIVMDLCRRAMFLDRGKIRADGRTTEVVAAYHATLQAEPPEVMWPFESAPGDETAKLRAARVRTPNGDVGFHHRISSPIVLEIEFWLCRPDASISPRFWVYTDLGQHVFTTRPLDPLRAQQTPGCYRASCTIPGDYLNTGHFRVDLNLYKDDRIPILKQSDVMFFEVYEENSSDRGFTSDWPGVVRPHLPWTTERIGELP